jgi:MFS superfamily sulfate permease-like transporter
MKFLAGLLPFGLLSVIFIGDIFKRKQGSAAGFLGIWILAVILGVISLLIPTFWWPWFNLLIVPAGLFSTIMIMALIMGLEQAQKQRKKQAVSDQPPYDV